MLKTRLYLILIGFLFLCSGTALLQAGDYPKYSPAWHMKKHGSYPKEFKKKTKAIFTVAEPFPSNDTRGQGMKTFNILCHFEGHNYGEMNLLVSKSWVKRFQQVYVQREDRGKTSSDFKSDDVMEIEGWVAQAKNGRVQMMFSAPKEW